MAMTYTVQQGDSITALAERHGLFSETIWTHPSNEELAKKRSHMNELLPGDKVFIPELRPKRHQVAAGKAHRFRRKGVPAQLVLKIAYLGLPRAEQDYVLTVGKEKLTGTTDTDGILEQFVPAQAKEGTLVIGPDAFELVIHFGHQDPHDELSGIQRRLGNLGYLDGAPSGKLDDATRRALLAFESSYSLPAKGEPTDDNGGVLVDVHRGARDFGPRAKLSDGWPSAPTGQTATKTATMSASFSAGGSGGKSPGDGKTPRTLNVFNVPPPVGHYVILGRGVTGWYNHLTLLQDQWGQARLTPHMPVMHLGYAEPWVRRGQERMGQWPRMLDFFDGLDPQGIGPGLALQGVPAQHQQNDWLPSATFAANLQRAETTVLNHYLFSKRAGGNWQVSPAATRLSTVELRDGFVTVIERFQNWQGRAGLPQAERDRWDNAAHTWGEQSIWHNINCEYRLSVYHQGHHTYVYAHKIDVCTGPGQPRLFRPAFFGGNAALYQEHLPAYDEIPARYDQGAAIPRIINGNDFIGAQNNANEIILVFKGNPVGAQSVQSALDMPNIGNPAGRVWWLVNKSLHHELGADNIPRMGNDADVPGKRNLLEQIGNDALIFNEAQDITNNHINWLFWTQQGFRDAQFQNRLMRVGFHEIAGFQEAPNGKIIVQVNLHPYGDVGRPVPQYIPRLAEASLRVMQQAHPVGPYPNEMNTRHDPEPVTGNAREHIDTLTVDRVVYSLGQDRGPRSEGTAAYLVQLLAGMHAVNLAGFPAYITDNQVDPDDANGVAGRVRVLGAAIVDGPGIANAGQRQAVNQGHANHGNFVPQEAPAGGGGMNMAITNIRRANACAVGPVRINFATANELQAAGLSAATAQRIVAARSVTTRGFTVQQCGFLLALAGFLAGPAAVAADGLWLLTNPAQFAF